MYNERSIAETEKLLETSIKTGLAEAEAEKRRIAYGENRLKGKKEKRRKM